MRRTYRRFYALTIHYPKHNSCIWWVCPPSRRVDIHVAVSLFVFSSCQPRGVAIHFVHCFTHTLCCRFLWEVSDIRHCLSTILVLHEICLGKLPTLSSIECVIFSDKPSAGCNRWLDRFGSWIGETLSPCSWCDRVNGNPSRIWHRGIYATVSTYAT